MFRLAVAVFLLFVGATTSFAQPPATLRVEVRSPGGPAPNATVVVNDVAHTANELGVVAASVAPGAVTVTVRLEGFVETSREVTVAAGAQQTLVIELEPVPTHEEEITVTATRTGRRVDDQAMRVEVLQREEIEEKMLMTPGDIVMMLNEMGGMRVQATSPSLGAASVRVQGMRGRYTRFLSDGLPLYGEQPGGLGLLQIPPMDLGHVEVIKGVASALYGAGAMGGVINLNSRRPGDEREREILVNRSTRGATDTVLWWSGPMNDAWGFTVVGGGHWQEQTDVNDDGWADLPGYSRGIVRPRLFWSDERGSSFFATTGFTWEERRGGTLDDGTLAQTGAPFRESLDTVRIDGGAAGHTMVGGKYLLAARAAASSQHHDHLFGDARERDRHQTVFGEVTLRGTAGRQTWVAGAALEHDRYTPEDVPRFAYRYTVPGVFGQYDADVTPWLTTSLSGRLDRHSEYGTFFSPRVSALVRHSGWTARVSGGGGFFAPTALTEETEAAGLSRLSMPEPLRAERGRSASLDLTRALGPLSSTLTLFASRVKHSVHVEHEDAYVITNLDRPTTTSGIELLNTFRHEPFAVTATYTYVKAREHAGIAADVPLTPRHSAGVVAMIESEDAGRLGVEWYYTGRQRLEANPYRTSSEPYVVIGLMGERRFGRLRVFLNGENLTGVRQTRWDPLVRSTRAADGRWGVDVWAPLEGRNINGGVRIQF
jgi:iron complex outermembrane receptor protein